MTCGCCSQTWPKTPTDRNPEPRYAVMKLQRRTAWYELFFCENCGVSWRRDVA